MDIKKNISFYRNDFPRLKAKIYYKLRQIYLNIGKNRIRYRTAEKFRKAKDIPEKMPDRIYLTKIVNPSAGIGDQLASWITGRYYAELFQVNYAYSPLYPKKWNDFLGFAKDQVSLEELIHKQHYKKVWLPPFDEADDGEKEKTARLMRLYQDQKVVFLLELTQIYAEQYGVIGRIRPMFHAVHREQEELIYDPERINIALHIRRGDIVQDGSPEKAQLQNRWLDNSYYMGILDSIMRYLSGAGFRIYIFSQGKKEEFKEFRKYGQVEFCNEMPAAESFLHMVKADILITSKSSFSYKPALLSYGIKICPQNFWHGYPEAEDWILADDRGRLDQSKLERAIHKLRHSDRG